MGDTTDATKPCRNHPHHCPGCGKEIECGYVCCATCIPPMPEAAEAALMRAGHQLATLTAERDRLREDIRRLEVDLHESHCRHCHAEEVEAAELSGAEKALRWAYHNDAWRKVLMGGVSVGSNDTEDSYAQRGLSALFPPPAPDARGGV